MSTQGTIVVGVDGSDCSRTALEFALEEAVPSTGRAAGRFGAARGRVLGDRVGHVPVAARGTVGRRREGHAGRWSRTSSASAGAPWRTFRSRSAPWAAARPRAGGPVPRRGPPGGRAPRTGRVPQRRARLGRAAVRPARPRPGDGGPPRAAARRGRARTGGNPDHGLRPRCSGPSTRGRGPSASCRARARRTTLEA